MGKHSVYFRGSDHKREHYTSEELAQKDAKWWDTVLECNRIKIIHAPLDMSDNMTVSVGEDGNISSTHVMAFDIPEFTYSDALEADMKKTEETEEPENGIEIEDYQLRMGFPKHDNPKLRRPYVVIDGRIDGLKNLRVARDTISTLIEQTESDRR